MKKANSSKLRGRNFNRRAFGATAGSAILLGHNGEANGSPVAVKHPKDSFFSHLIQRCGFGGSLLDQQWLATSFRSADDYLEHQLAGKGDLGDELSRRLSSIDTLQLGQSELREREYGRRNDTVVTPVFQKLMQLPIPATNYPNRGRVRGPVTNDLIRATLLRAMLNRNQLHEILVDFWGNHFSIDALKGDCRWLKMADDKMIRQHAMGSFRDLLYASICSPAMMVYLDNTDGDKCNENYGRELLELHTVGVDAGYTLEDIRAAARCVSGWSIAGEFSFRPGLASYVGNSKGPFQVMQYQVIQSGLDGIRELANKLASDPHTARFICQKLAMRFVSDHPSDGLVDSLSTTFLKSDGEICAVLKTMFASSEFRVAANQKLKKPFNYIVSAMRACGITDVGDGTSQYLEQMGQPLFQHTTPDGYPEQSRFWSGAFWHRWNFATQLATGTLRGSSFDANRFA